MSTILEAATAAIESDERLDRPAYDLSNTISVAVQLAGEKGVTAQNLLHGTFLRHPLHPALATVPVGCWVLTFGLDSAETVGVTDDPGLRGAADVALAAGCAGATLAAVAGLADWRKTQGRERRTGIVHAALNSTALGLSVASIALRRSGRRAAGRAASAAGFAAMLAGAWLGGHMVYRRGVGVDHAERSPEPRSFASVLPFDALEEGHPRRVEVWDDDARTAVGIVLVRRGSDVFAMGARCSHYGGPLEEGWVERGGLVCPWHGSRFCLATGAVLDGPSTAPQPAYDTRVAEGFVELRRRQDPGHEAVTPEDLAKAFRRNPEPPGPVDAERADDVLRDHHTLLRRLLARVEATPREDPERRDLMRTLARELLIHDHVEDTLFYPAVRPFTESVPSAKAEHQQINEMLARTLRLGPASEAFEEQLRALAAAVEGHLASEEAVLFEEAERLGERRLRALGRDLAEALERERDNRLRSEFRQLRLDLMEGMIPPFRSS